ncbi:DUF4395 domain-containing protein, partial [archaeon]|nr:DUF4395 domain-containing protein [archaeon]
MVKKRSIFQFGKIVPGLEIDGKSVDYAVVNERDARAGAGIMVAIAAIAFAQAFLLKEYIWIDVLVLLFLVEFAIRIINPSIAPFYAMGSFIVRKMRPEYSGAAQKRFAWGLGLLMALTVTTLIHIVGYRGIWNLTFCIICLFLMWVESSFGICIGCKLYHFSLKMGFIKKPEVLPTCPGGACPINRPK